ncbi:MAG: four helix bundle protein [Deltaproteobacteria bacterium]|jgi:four helix bundle protein|nr:four helix bundle protein [Deltaproteobacteria bacterium]
MTKQYDDFRDLEVWNKCRDIRRKIWDVCKEFPGEEKYRLSDQMIRASRSSTACIAEGYGRYHYQENIQFCRQSRGSLYELIDHVDVALECEYLDNNYVESLTQEIKTAIRILNGYIKYLKVRKATKQ